MEGFRDLLEDLGHSDVATRLDSGNRVFAARARASGSALAARFAKALTERIGVTVSVVVKSQARWRAVVEAKPWTGRAENSSQVLVALAPNQALQS